MSPTYNSGRAMGFRSFPHMGGQVDWKGVIKPRKEVQTMNVTMKNEGINPKTMFRLTQSNVVQKLSSQAGQVVDVADYVIFDDVKPTGEVVEILAIRTSDGEMFGTNSQTIIKGFKAIIEAFGEPVPFEVLEGIGRSGRTYYYIDIVDD